MQWALPVLLPVLGALAVENMLKTKGDYKKKNAFKKDKDSNN